MYTWTLALRLLVTKRDQNIYITNFIATDHKTHYPPPHVLMRWLNEARRRAADTHRVSTTAVGVEWFGWVSADEQALD